VKALIDRGWANRLMLGHDYAPAPVLAGRDQAPMSPTRYLHLSQVAIPGLMELGVSDEVVQQIMVENPRKFLTGE
jgi:phosphotriesterase-related protein